MNVVQTDLAMPRTVNKAGLNESALIVFGLLLQYAESCSVTILKQAYWATNITFHSWNYMRESAVAWTTTHDLNPEDRIQ